MLYTTYYILALYSRARAPQDRASFHLGQDVSAEQESHWLSLGDRHGHRYRLRHLSVPDLNFSVAIESDWVAPRYNLKEKASTVRVRLPGVMGACLMSLLEMQPEAEPPRSVWSAKELPTEATRSEDRVLRLDYDSAGRKFVVYLNPGGREFEDGGVSTDAIYALICIQEGQVPQAGFLSGKYLHCGNIRLEAAGEPGGFSGETD